MRAAADAGPKSALALLTAARHHRFTGGQARRLPYPAAGAPCGLPPPALLRRRQPRHPCTCAHPAGAGHCGALGIEGPPAAFSRTAHPGSEPCAGSASSPPALDVSISAWFPSSPHEDGGAPGGRGIRRGAPGHELMRRRGGRAAVLRIWPHAAEASPAAGSRSWIWRTPEDLTSATVRPDTR
jgi:hypothetical protein